MSKEIFELEEQREIISKKLSKLYLEKALSLCPYKEGDIITNRGGTRRAKIANITSSQYAFADYKLWGYWLKKDGTLGEMFRELYWFEWHPRGDD